jgi:hypothetical protein
LRAGAEPLAMKAAEVALVDAEGFEEVGHGSPVGSGVCHGYGRRQFNAASGANQGGASRPITARKLAQTPALAARMRYNAGASSL